MNRLAILGTCTLLSLATGSCIRQDFDLCATDPPHPECEDAGTSERSDSGSADAGSRDAGPPDAGSPDAGPPDAGPPDAGPPDAGPPDAGLDAGGDGGNTDAGITDAAEAIGRWRDRGQGLRDGHDSTIA